MDIDENLLRQHFTYASKPRISSDDAGVFLVAGAVLFFAAGLFIGLHLGERLGRKAEKADQFLRDNGAEVLSAEDGVERYRVVRYPKP